MKNKRKARVLSLQVMYAYDLRSGDDSKEVFNAIVENKAYKSDVVEYARTLVSEAIRKSSEIDSLLKKHIANWDVQRLSTIDRNILRLAVAELITQKDVPYKVIIDEAVEIAKMYSTEDSGKFVNGVIDAVYKEIAR